MKTPENKDQLDALYFAMQKTKNKASGCGRVKCTKAARYKYRQNERNHNNPKRSEYYCRERRYNTINETWDEIDLAPDKPVLRFSKADRFDVKVPIPILTATKSNCYVSFRGFLTRSDGVQVTIHECEAHWVIATWVTEAQTTAVKRPL